MSRKKLIKQLKNKNPKLTQKESEIVLDVFLESIYKALKQGNNIQIRSLGHWYQKKLKENYNARNPATNELIYKPERIKIRFKPSKNLKKIINQ